MKKPTKKKEIPKREKIHQIDDSIILNTKYYLPGEKRDKKMIATRGEH